MTTPGWNPTTNMAIGFREDWLSIRVPEGHVTLVSVPSLAMREGARFGRLSLYRQQRRAGRHLVWSAMGTLPPAARLLRASALHLRFLNEPALGPSFALPFAMSAGFKLLFSFHQVGVVSVSPSPYPPPPTPPRVAGLSVCGSVCLSVCLSVLRF